MKRNASVTMKDGRPERITMVPLIEPTSAAKMKVAGIATISGNPQFTTQTAKNSPAKATIEPMERSNSPPIIRSAAPMARIPSCAAGVMKFMKPAMVNIDRSAVTRKKRTTRTTPAIAPSSGRFMSFEPNDSALSRSSTV